MKNETSNVNTTAENETVTLSKAPVQSPAENTQVYDSEAKKWGEVLNKQEKVSVKIKKKNDKDTAPYPVAINGYVYLIKKGEKVDVPKSVAAILEEADII